ncbi:MAG: hypothetical protein US70_C0034G0006 [Parcubacteria group bacterium GW2011_GWD2_38_11]|nr:MAG: hypothetical protein US70_C0034G0006 [Parcubacteria group bacterium GW2011_GWD2_38_11]
MLNKKIASEIALGIIVLLAIVVGGIFWMENGKEVVNNSKPVIEKEPTEKVVYGLRYNSTLSGYERARTKSADDAYLEIFSIDPETKMKNLLFSDKDKSFVIDTGYNSPKFVQPGVILFSAMDRISNERVFKLLDFNSGSTTDLPTLPLPDNFSLNDPMTSILSDGRFVYIAGSEFESGIFICDKDLTGMKKIFSTLDHDGVSINSIAISKDDKKIAFSIGADGVGQGNVEENIYIMNSDGGNLKKVFNEKYTIGNVVEWLDDNKHFIFDDGMNSDESDFSIVSINGDKQSINSPGVHLKMSPSGTRILSSEFFPEESADVRLRGVYRLFVSDMNGQKVDNITSVKSEDGLSANSIGWIID